MFLELAQVEDDDSRYCHAKLSVRLAWDCGATEKVFLSEGSWTPVGYEVWRLKFLDDQAEARDLFHKLWTKSVGQEGYDKAEWMRLHQLLGL